MTIGQEIRQARGDQSQQVFAAQAGIALSTLTRLEKDGDANPTIAVLEAIAQAAGKRLVIRFSDRAAVAPKKTVRR